MTVPHLPEKDLEDPEGIFFADPEGWNLQRTAAAEPYPFQHKEAV